MNRTRDLAQLPLMHDITVAEFLQRRHLATPLPTPLTCERGHKLVDVLDSMLGWRVHRSWFVNAHGYPQGVITFTDIIAAVYKSEYADNILPL